MTGPLVLTKSTQAIALPDADLAKRNLGRLKRKEGTHETYERVVGNGKKVITMVTRARK